VQENNPQVPVTQEGNWMRLPSTISRPNQDHLLESASLHVSKIPFEAIGAHEQLLSFTENLN
jgi:hypothetical protein